MTKDPNANDRGERRVTDDDDDLAVARGICNAIAIVIIVTAVAFIFILLKK